MTLYDQRLLTSTICVIAAICYINGLHSKRAILQIILLNCLERVLSTYIGSRYARLFRVRNKLYCIITDFYVFLYVNVIFAASVA